MNAVPDTAVTEVVATYRARRAALLAEAAKDEYARRPLNAAEKRQAARQLSLYIASELIDRRPEGIGALR